MDSFYAKASLLGGALACVGSLGTGFASDALGLVYSVGALLGLALAGLIRALLSFLRFLEGNGE